MRNYPSSHSLLISCPFSQAHPKYPLPWNHNGLIPTCWVPEALFTSFISHEGPSYSAPSFVHVHTASLSSWGVRSVHQTLCWILMLIISNPHSKMRSKYWPHFTDEETETKWDHILVWGLLPVKQKSCTLNQLMSVQSLLFHIMPPRWWLKVYLKWRQLIKVTQDLKASTLRHVSVNKLTILCPSKWSMWKNIKLEFINLIPLNMCSLNIFKSLKDNMETNVAHNIAYIMVTEYYYCWFI